MTTTQAGEKHGARQIAALLARALLGGLFIYLGLTKVFHQADFMTLVQKQLMVSNASLAGVIVAVAPWLEVLYGLWLLSGRALDKGAVVARWWLGCVFIFMGLHKAVPEPGKFLALVHEYDMVSNYFVLNCIGAMLPWFEVYCGVLLLTGVAVRAAALNVIVMLVPFTFIVLKRALVIAATDHLPFCAVKFDCGCGAGEVFICHKLVENTVLFLLSVWLLTGRGRQLCLRFSLRREKDPLVREV